MRIRKRTPARAASPPGLSASPPLPLPLQHHQPKGKPEEEEDGLAAAAEEEEKRVILIAVGARDDREQDDDRVPAPTCSENSATDDAPPEPKPQDATRCSRNDGKRWRCKSAAAPGYLFCDRHVAWSTRKRKPRARGPKKTKIHHQGADGDGPGLAAT